MSDLPVTVYTPDSSLSHPWQLLRDMFRDLVASRELAFRLAVRDISAQYRQAVLGILWAFILPIANALVWVFLNGTGAIKVGGTAIPYPAYVFVGTMLWGIFLDAMNTPMTVTNGAKSMLTKINFPREALILSGIYLGLFNAAIKLILLALVPFYLGIELDWSMAWFPLGVFGIIMLGTTIGLFLTPIGMLYTDIGRASSLLMQFVFFITPAAFPPPTLPWAAAIFRYNPLTPLIETSRDWLTGQPPEYLGYFLVVVAAMSVLLLVFWMFYRLSMPILIERMSA